MFIIVFTRDGKDIAILSLALITRYFRLELIKRCVSNITRALFMIPYASITENSSSCGEEDQSRCLEPWRVTTPFFPAARKLFIGRGNNFPIIQASKHNTTTRFVNNKRPGRDRAQRRKRLAKVVLLRNIFGTLIIWKSMVCHICWLDLEYSIHIWKEDVLVKILFPNRNSIFHKNIFWETINCLKKMFK